ncbi:MAG: hypothetical protein KatS3mg105_4822 [Gemmatales bacterium]|nr:MAG: hypothetical protein KatS3mg105_4822 [Gemmatales bacterium]
MNLHCELQRGKLYCRPEVPTTQQRFPPPLLDGVEPASCSRLWQNVGCLIRTSRPGSL